MPRSMLSRASTENLTSLAAMLMCFQPFIFIPRSGRQARVSKYKAVAFGPLSTTLGACTLAGFTVITDEIDGQTWALRRLFHSPG
jgi:hypothetical protein